MVVSIDEEFSRNLDQNLPAEVQLILDGRKSNTAQILSGYASNIIQQFNQDFTAAWVSPSRMQSYVPAVVV